MNVKNIHIGKLIKYRVQEMQISSYRISNFMKCSDEEIQEMYQQSNIDTYLLLKWSKLLKYDFFRIYTGHLILYAPPSRTYKSEVNKQKTQSFRKNIYTQEVKNFILGKVNEKQMTPLEVVERYKIPKTTLYKWIKKE